VFVFRLLLLVWIKDVITWVGAEKEKSIEEPVVHEQVIVQQTENVTFFFIKRSNHAIYKETNSPRLALVVIAVDGTFESRFDDASNIVVSTNKAVVSWDSCADFELLGELMEIHIGG